MSAIDSARAVRSGEEIDAEKLLFNVREPLEQALGFEISAPLEIEQFPSGHSNLTYLVRARGKGGEARELVLRRPPFGNVVKTAHDMGREVKILTALASPGARYTKGPRPLVYVDDTSVMGSPFYLMTRLSGIVLRRKAPAGVALAPETLAALSKSMVSGLIEIHSIPWEQIGLSDYGRPEGYVERQVKGWAKRYVDAQTDEVPDMDRASAWLVDHLPKALDERKAATVVHNDFKYDNIVLDPADITRIVGVLDWEMTTIGDPLTDLATTLAYWVEDGDPDPLKQFAFGPTHLPGSMKRREFADAYAKESGRDISNLPYFYAFALFKNAVVAQQIYKRFKQGLTKDERFAMMIFGVRLLGEAAVRCIDTGAM